MSKIARAIPVYVGAVLLAAAGVALSWVFREGFSAPNYGLGMVIATVTAFFLFGLWPGLLCAVLTIFGFIYFLLPPAYALQIDTTTDILRTVTLAITMAVAALLVMLLREARMRADELARRSRKASEELVTANDELRATNEELRETALRLEEAQKQLHESLRYETNIARSLQAAFLPEVPEQIGQARIAVAYVPGSEEAEIGGDFYDAFVMPNGNYAVTIGDASGKGLLAAKQAITAKFEYRFCAMECCEDVGDCARRLNDSLAKDVNFSGFVTAFLASFDPENMTLKYVLAGHEPPVLYRYATGEMMQLERGGRLIGAVEDAQYEERILRLESGDRLILYTDGLSEAGTGGRLIGVDGVVDLLKSEFDTDTMTMLARILDRARSFAGGRFRDDVAVMLMCIS